MIDQKEKERLRAKPWKMSFKDFLYYFPLSDTQENRSALLKQNAIEERLKTSSKEAIREIFDIAIDQSKQLNGHTFSVAAGGLFAIQQIFLELEFIWAPRYLIATFLLFIVCIVALILSYISKIKDLELNHSIRQLESKLNAHVEVLASTTGEKGKIDQLKEFVSGKKESTGDLDMDSQLKEIDPIWKDITDITFYHQTISKLTTYTNLLGYSSFILAMVAFGIFGYTNLSNHFT